jgi:hypothetical protein
MKNVITMVIGYYHLNFFIIKNFLLKKFLAWSFVKCIAFDVIVFQVQKSFIKLKLKNKLYEFFI